MGWGGKRAGAGRKRTPPDPSKPRQVAVTKLTPRAPLKVEAEAKKTGVFDAAAWAELLPQIEEISKRYAIKKTRRDTPHLNPFKPPKFPKSAEPKDSKLLMANDSALMANLGFAGQEWLDAGILDGVTAEGVLFLGYTYLSELAQRPEYRVISETIADDATRRWIDFDVVGEEKDQAEARKKDPVGFDERMADPDEKDKRVDQAGKTDVVKALKDDQDRLEVKARFYEQCRNDGFFGRSHLFLDFGVLSQSEEELKTPIGDGRDRISQGKVSPEAPLMALRTIEPVWTYPLNYNADNPLLKSWYNPQVWQVMGKLIDGSRLLTFIGHPVPDMLKPGYAFGGLSLSQMAKPYVDIWLNTRQSVGALIHSFSVMVLKTNLGSMVAPNAAAPLLMRIALFNMLRDNQGTFAIDKETEDFANVSASLAGLDKLQAQAQEHMCCKKGTLIETARGAIPIEQIRPDDKVLTRAGYRPIKWMGVTKQTDTFIRIAVGSSVLMVTEEHPIWVESQGDFVAARNVKPFHRLTVLKTRSQENTGRQSRGAAAGGRVPRRAITAIRKLAAFCTVFNGRSIVAAFRSAMKSTMVTETAPTMIGEICSASLGPSTWLSTDARVVHSLNFTASNAAFAQNRSLLRWIEPSIAPNPANKRRSGFETDGSRGIFTRLFASVAASISNPKRPEPNSAQIGVSSESGIEIAVVKTSTQDVYDIEVDGPPEFFAEGILVHNSSVTRIPLVKLTGISPTGLNATSEQEIEVYDDSISGYQERFMRPHLERVINFQQLSLFGKIDPELSWKFNPLRQVSETEKGEKQQKDAERNQKYVDMGALSPGEVRKVIIDDPDLPYTGFDPEDVPEPPIEEGMVGPGTEGSEDPGSNGAPLDGPSESEADGED